MLIHEFLVDWYLRVRCSLPDLSRRDTNDDLTQVDLRARIELQYSALDYSIGSIEVEMEYAKCETSRPRWCVVQRLTTMQMARCFVRSFPFYPDIPAIAAWIAVAEKDGLALSKLPIMEASASPASSA